MQLEDANISGVLVYTLYCCPMRKIISHNIMHVTLQALTF